MGPAQSDTARVFFALWPPASCLAALEASLHAAQVTHGGRGSHLQSLHLTLLFLGAAPRRRLGTWAELAEALPPPAFDLQLDRIGCWRHNRIVYLAPSSPPEALLALAGDLRHQALAAGFEVETRPFRPHVTLLRHAECQSGAGTERPCPTVQWPASGFVLVESQLGAERARYDVLRRYGLS